MYDGVWLLVDSLIALGLIAAPWALLVFGSDALGIEFPECLDTGLLGMVLFVSWAIYAMYLARQITVWMGFGY